MPTKRTFGWIQNPGDLRKLKKVIGVFQKDSPTHKWLTTERLPMLMKYKLINPDDYKIFQAELAKSEIEVSYPLLKGKGSGASSRKNALCSGIIQAVIDAQSSRTYSNSSGVSVTMKKPYTDDWSADGYLRWAISCGLLEYNHLNDTCKISSLGQKLASSINKSSEEYESLSTALLAYPPVIRILTLLKEKSEQTKFELGSQLGFIGELGFTSIPQEIFLYDYCNATTPAEKKEIRSNFEGDSDKYARGIASWLIQMHWVTSHRKNISTTYERKIYSADLQVYSLTRAGEKALLKAHGNSSNPRLPRIVMFEMLASNKTPNAEFLRLQRSLLLKSIANSWKTLEQIKKALNEEDMDLSGSAIVDHISGLSSIGLNISEHQGKYKLRDKIIHLEIPEQTAYSNDSVNELKEIVRSKLQTVDHKYLILIDLAYSDASSTRQKAIVAKEFEIQTAELFTKELNFSGLRLGDANRPDVVIYYGNNGTIIDNKSYKDGFTLDKHNSDEMSRYINENRQRISGVPNNEWWKNFPETVANFTFLFVSSFFKGRLADQLSYISKTQGNIKGAAINIENLLYLAEVLKTGKLPYPNFFDLFQNQEIVFTS